MTGLCHALGCHLAASHGRGPQEEQGEILTRSHAPFGATSLTPRERAVETRKSSPRSLEASLPTSYTITRDVTRLGVRVAAFGGHVARLPPVWPLCASLKVLGDGMAPIFLRRPSANNAAHALMSRSTSIPSHTVG